MKRIWAFQPLPLQEARVSPQRGWQLTPRCSVLPARLGLCPQHTVVLPLPRDREHCDDGAGSPSHPPTVGPAGRSWLRMSEGQHRAQRAAYYMGRVCASLSVPIRTGHWPAGWTLAPRAPVLVPLCKAGQLNPAWQLCGGTGGLSGGIHRRQVRTGIPVRTTAA